MTYDYSDALRFMKRGFIMRRRAWKSDKAVRVHPGNPDPKLRELSYLEIQTAEGCAPYTPSRCDQFNDDWVLF